MRSIGVVVVACALVAVLSGPGSWAQTADCLTLENFSDNRIGQFPADWRVRKDDGKHVYSVREEGGLRFLRAVSRGLGIQGARRNGISALPRARVVVAAA